MDDIEEFRKVMEGLTPGRPFLIRALRGDNTRFSLIVPRTGEFQAAR